MKRVSSKHPSDNDSYQTSFPANRTVSATRKSTEATLLEDAISPGAVEDEGAFPEEGPGYWAEKGKELMDENYLHLYGVAQVSEILGISASYFYDAFSASFKIPPKHYLTNLKIKRAKAMLLTSQSKVREITIKVGFKNRVAFERSFKKLVGISPSEYRQSLAVLEKDTRK